MRTWYQISSGHQWLWLIILTSLGLAMRPAPPKKRTECPVSFIRQELVDTSSIYAPYALMRFGNFDFSYLDKENSENRNLDEWLSRYPDCDIDRRDIYQVIYKSSEEDLEEWRAATVNPNMPLPRNLHNNTFAEANVLSGCTDVADYIIFARKCEPLVIAPQKLWRKNQFDIEAARELMKEGGRLFKKTDSHFLRLRIAYQVIRLAHYAREYRKVLELYDYFLPKIDKIESIIYWWILAHKAGAEYRLGKKTLAAYHFAQVFQHSPAKRRSAFESFRIENNQQWNDVLLMCKSKMERAGLYAMRAAMPRSRIIDEMEQIYKLVPDHSSLEPLLLRLLRQLEPAFLPSDSNQTLQGFPPTRAQRAQLKRLKSLVTKVIRDGKGRHPEVWKIAKAYILLLENNWPQAEMAFGEIKTNNPKLRRTIARFKTLMAIERLDYVTADSPQDLITQVESAVFNIITGDAAYKRDKMLHKFLKDKMYRFYMAHDAPGKAVLFKYDKKYLTYIHDHKVLDDIIKTCEDEHPTRLETALITRKDNTTILNEVLEIQGTLYLAEGNLPAAKEILNRIPRSFRSKKKYAPFGETIQDCIQCPNLGIHSASECDTCPRQDSTAFIKQDLIEQLEKFEYRAMADPEKGPKYFNLLGTAWYNMSYFGYSWNATDYHRGGNNWYYSPNMVFPDSISPFGNKENQDLSKAKYYFSKALTLAKDKEDQARAAFGLARIDQKEYFVSPECTYTYDSTTNRIPKLPSKRMTFYNILFRDYHDTEFFRQVIAECKYIEFYLHGKSSQ